MGKKKDFYLAKRTFLNINSEVAVKYIVQNSITTSLVYSNKPLHTIIEKLSNNDINQLASLGIVKEVSHPSNVPISEFHDSECQE